MTTHINPDGDGLGSQMALHYYLKKTGKHSIVLNGSPTPEKFNLVDPRGEIQVFDQGQSLPKVDAVLVLDTSDYRMLGPMQAPLKALGVPIIFFDHHVPETDDVENHLIDEQYAATGELIYSFLRHLRADIDAEIALALYVSIVTDTGSFRFKRTSSRSHLIASELLQKGVSPERVFHEIYARDSLNKLKLFGHVMKHIKTRCEDRIAWVEVSRKDRDKYGASVEDTESYINQLSLIKGVDIALMFREEEDGRTKVSIRGTGEVAVVGIARKFGGGGHRHAAGMKMAVSMEKTIKQVLNEAEQLLAEYPKQVA